MVFTECIWKTKLVKNKRIPLLRFTFLLLVSVFSNQLVLGNGGQESRSKFRRPGNAISGKYIVVFKDRQRASSNSEKSLIGSKAGSIELEYNPITLRGYVVRMEEDKAQE